MSSSRDPRLWVPLLLAAALMAAPGSPPAEAHANRVVLGNSTSSRALGHANSGLVEGDGRMIQGNGRAVQGKGRPVRSQMTVPAGARVELFVNGKLVYSGQVNRRVSVNANSRMVHRDGGMVNGTGKGKRFVNGNGRRLTNGTTGRFATGNGGRFVSGNGRPFVLPPHRGNGAVSGGY
jgi:hypothetical protein